MSLKKLVYGGAFILWIAPILITILSYVPQGTAIPLLIVDVDVPIYLPENFLYVEHSYQYYYVVWILISCCVSIVDLGVESNIVSLVGFILWGLLIPLCQLIPHPDAVPLISEFMGIPPFDSFVSSHKFISWYAILSFTFMIITYGFERREVAARKKALEKSGI